MSAAYYNEIDPGAAQWLRNLIKAGLIAAGEVDERSIEDIRPEELRGFTQVHFFAGIGVWSYALRRAGWDDTRPVWTGSCPCQPFSAAGKGNGFADERHLWPAWFHLIAECRPAAIFGEQVASKDADPWIDLVQTDLEALGYAVGAIPFPSAGVGAPHIRDRLYWLADAAGPRPSKQRRDRLEPQGRATSGSTGILGDAGSAGLAQRIGIAGVSGRAHGAVAGQAVIGAGIHPGGLAHMHGHGCEPRRKGFSAMGHGAPTESGSRLIGMADAELQSGCAEHEHQPRGWKETGPDHIAELGGDGEECRPGPTNGFWRAADWLGCRDGKWRPVEPGTFPLAHGAASRVVRLRAYGNAINAEAAQAMIEAYLQTEQARDKLAEKLLEQAA